jgi:hypothetical protein
MLKKRPAGIIVLFIAMAVPATCSLALSADYPKWVEALRLKVDRTFSVKAAVRSVSEPDRLAPGKTFSFMLQGKGFLSRIPDPFDEMDKLFRSDGWVRIERYQADGHGSSSFGFQKDERFCVVSVAIDSVCDDDEQGRVPCELQFDIYCR